MAALTLSGQGASAQGNPRGTMFLGYSYGSMDLGSGTRSNFQGYDVSHDYILKDWLAIPIKNDGYFGCARVPFCNSTNTSCVISGGKNSANLWTLMGGFQIQNVHGRVMPFARALYGVAFLEACPFFGCESKATQDYGAGLQVRITEKRFGWRVEGDFLQTHLFGRAQNDFRLGTGPVIVFYGHRH
jgi:hypothetical protein